MKVSYILANFLHETPLLRARPIYELFRIDEYVDGDTSYLKQIAKNT